LTRILEKNGIDFDIAAVSAEFSRLSGKFIYSRDHQELAEQNLIYGEAGRAGLAFYCRRFSGVTKDKANAFYHYPMINTSAPREEVVQVRKDAQIIADELYKLVE